MASCLRVPAAATSVARSRSRSRSGSALLSPASSAAVAATVAALKRGFAGVWQLRLDAATCGLGGSAGAGAGGDRWFPLLSARGDETVGALCVRLEYQVA